MCKFVVGLLTKKCKLFLGRDNMLWISDIYDMSDINMLPAMFGRTNRTTRFDRLKFDICRENGKAENRIE